MYKVEQESNGGRTMNIARAGDPSLPLHIRLFGAFDVRVHGNAIPPLRSRKVQWLLALLALRHDQALDRAWLAGTLWPESTQSQALYNLRQSLSNLRHVLGEAGHCLQPSMVNALTFKGNAAHIDVLAFDAAVAVGDVASLEHAVALYRGPLLEGCGEDWAFAERRFREESYLSALEKLAQAALARGEAGAAVPYLRVVIQVDPLREQAQRALIQTLAALGDYGAAVQVYRELRLLLRRELNTDPDPQTVALFQRIRAEARCRLAVSAPPLRPSSPTPPPRLPSFLTALVGRRSELEQIVMTLRGTRLLTLTGTGGVGKTRLAIAAAEEVAADYPDGVCFVDLAPLSDPGLIAQTVMSALRVREAPEQPALSTLQDYLQGRTLLLLLDNCEHLLDASAHLADALLRHCPGLCLLATSRQALGLTGEVGWWVPSLSVPDLSALAGTGHRSGKEWLSLLGESEAVELFVVRARQVASSFQMSSRNAVAVGQICCHLDGIPLAIELAAARLRSLSVEEIHNKLDDRFRLLTGGSRTALPRQQTLRALMDWSYDLLTDPERVLLARLSVFAGGWTLEAAELVCSDMNDEKISASSVLIESWDVLDALTSLIDKSLVQVEEQRGSVRYRMLETVRAYAWDRLASSGESEGVRSRHRDYFLGLAEQLRLDLRGPEQTHGLAVLEEEHDNLRQALTFCLEASEGGEAGLRLGGALQEFWRRRGHLREGRLFLTAVLSRPVEQDHLKARADALNGAGVLTSNQGDYAAARALHQESLALRRELGDRRGIAFSLQNLGNMAYNQSDYPAAHALYEESLTIFRELSDKLGIAVSLSNLGTVMTSQGKYAEAQTLYEESVAIFQELGDKWNIADSLNSLGHVASNQGEYSAARTLYEKSLSLFRELGDKQGIALSLNFLGIVAISQGDYAAVQAPHEESLTIFRELGDKWGIAISTMGLGLGATSRGDYAVACALHQESLTIFRELSDMQGIAYSLEAFASLASVREQPGRAARLWGAAQALREKINLPLPPSDLAQYSRQVTQSRAAAGQEVFDLAWSEGRILTSEQAIDDVLSGGDTDVRTANAGAVMLLPDRERADSG